MKQKMMVIILCSIISIGNIFEVSAEVINEKIENECEVIIEDTIEESESEIQDEKVDEIIEEVTEDGFEMIMEDCSEMEILEEPFQDATEVNVLEKGSEDLFSEITVYRTDDSANKKVFEVYNDSAYDGLQNALDYVRDMCSTTSEGTYTVKVPEGEYIIDSSLKMYGRTVLDLGSGAVLKRDSKFIGSLLRFGRKEDYPKQYSGYENIVITGSSSNYGVFDGGDVSCSIIRFAHANNVRFKYLELKNVTSNHHMEFAASSNVTIENCKFNGFKLADGSDLTNYEAIQLDILESSHFPDYDEYDGTVNKNITIRNNEFSDLSRGVGTHSAQTGKYFGNVKILNNTFTNVTGYAIVGTNFKKAVIDGNVIKKSGSGIFFRNMNPGYTNFYGGDASKVSANCDSKITNNTIEIVEKNYDNKTFGIRIYGEKLTSDKTWKDPTTNTTVTIPKADYRLSNVTVMNNTVTLTTNANGIWMTGTNNSLIQNNSIVYKCSKSFSELVYAFKIEDSDNNSIALNTAIDSGVKRVVKDGINLKTGSDTNVINTNTITNIVESGVDIISSKSNTVTGNVIKNVGKHGIYVTEKSGTESAVNIIRNNRIEKPILRGICVYNGSYATISGNKIKKSGKEGICVTNGSYGYISKNTIESSGTMSIYINAKSSSATISNNTIKDSGDAAIFVNDDSTVKNINANTITNTPKHGIYVRKSKVSNVKGNMINTVKMKGIYFIEGAKYSNISENNVSNVNESGIVLGCVLKGYVIEKNNISYAGIFGIDLVGLTEGVVSGNKVTRCGNCEVRIQGSVPKKISSSELTLKTVSSTRGKVKLTWNTVLGIDDYLVYRSTSKNGIYKKIGSSKSSSYIDATVTKGKDFYYKIMPVTKVGKVQYKGKYTGILSIRVK